MTATFKPGDLVSLRSGGPPMVVAGWQHDPFGEPGWLVFWQIQGSPRREIFPEAVLSLYAPDDPSNPVPERRKPRREATRC